MIEHVLFKLGGILIIFGGFLSVVAICMEIWKG